MTHDTAGPVGVGVRTRVCCEPVREDAVMTLSSVGRVAAYAEAVAMAERDAEDRRPEPGPHKRGPAVGDGHEGGFLKLDRRISRAARAQQVEGMTHMQM